MFHHLQHLLLWFDYLIHECLVIVPVVKVDSSYVPQAPDVWAVFLYFRFDSMYPTGYTIPMVETRKTELFAKWLDNLHDIRAKARVLVRIERLASGNAGDVKPVGEGISEIRIDYGPGYRVYFMKRGSELIILLAGGDKSSQTADIKVALRLARDL